MKPRSPRSRFPTSRMRRPRPNPTPQPPNRRPPAEPEETPSRFCCGGRPASSGVPASRNGAAGARRRRQAGRRGKPDGRKARTRPQARRQAGRPAQARRPQRATAPRRARRNGRTSRARSARPASIPIRPSPSSPHCATSSRSRWRTRAGRSAPAHRQMAVLRARGEVALAGRQAGAGGPGAGQPQQDRPALLHGEAGRRAGHQPGAHGAGLQGGGARQPPRSGRGGAHALRGSVARRRRRRRSRPPMADPPQRDPGSDGRPRRTAARSTGCAMRNDRRCAAAAKSFPKARAAAQSHTLPAPVKAATSARENCLGRLPGATR